MQTMVFVMRRFLGIVESIHAHFCAHCPWNQRSVRFRTLLFVAEQGPYKRYSEPEKWVVLKSKAVRRRATNRLVPGDNPFLCASPGKTGDYYPVGFVEVIAARAALDP
jgi:hypothetical protein